MGRLDRRIRRLAERASEIQVARVEAELAGMSDDELKQRMVKAALVLGMPEELAQGDPEAVIQWGTEKLREEKRKLLTSLGERSSDPVRS